MKFAWYAQVVQASLSCLGDMFGRTPLLTNHALLHTFTPLSFPRELLPQMMGDLTTTSLRIWQSTWLHTTMSTDGELGTFSSWVFLFAFYRAINEFICSIGQGRVWCLAHVVHGDLITTSRQFLQWTWLDTTKPTDGVLDAFSSSPFACNSLSDTWIYLFYWPRQSLLATYSILNGLTLVVPGDLTTTSS